MIIRTGLDLKCIAIRFKLQESFRGCKMSHFKMSVIPGTNDLLLVCSFMRGKTYMKVFVPLAFTKITVFVK